MNFPTLSESTCKEKMSYFRLRMERLSWLTAQERRRLFKELQIFSDSLRTEKMILGSSALGLGAAVLPVIGLITGPIIGGFYGAYKANKLVKYRREAQQMLEELAE